MHSLFINLGTYQSIRHLSFKNAPTFAGSFLWPGSFQTIKHTVQLNCKQFKKVDFPFFIYESRTVKFLGSAARCCTIQFSTSCDGVHYIQRVNWMIIEDQTFSSSYDLAPPPFPSPISRLQVVSLSQSSCVSSVELTDGERGRRGGGGGRNQTKERRESKENKKKKKKNGI